MSVNQAPFPLARFRRTRAAGPIRNLVREGRLSVHDLIWPVFVCAGTSERQTIASMPGVERLSVDLLVEAAREAASLGIPAICIFPYTGMDARTEDCALAWDRDNIANRAIRVVGQGINTHKPRVPMAQPRGPLRRIRCSLQRPTPHARDPGLYRRLARENLKPAL